MLHHNKKNPALYLRIRELARHMHKNPTRAEEFFWAKVRNRQLFGLKFNRQYIIQCPSDGFYTKYYISDFHCHALKLVVELDGHFHLKRQTEDLIRTEQMGEWGYTVIRFMNTQVLEHWNEVESKIWDYMQLYQASSE